MQLMRCPSIVLRSLLSSCVELLRAQEVICSGNATGGMLALAQVSAMQLRSLTDSSDLGPTARGIQNDGSATLQAA
jgi:hypothetical protein